VTKYFATVNVVDFEYEVDDGGLPRPLCMVVYVLDSHLRHIRTIRMWRGEFRKTPPFDVGPDALFVAYSGWAEVTCFLVLGWQFSVHIYDLHTAFLAASNILLPYEPDETRKRPRKRLSDACRAYGIAGWERIDKEQMAEDIGQGLWRKYGKKRVLEYCEEDVANSAELLRRQLRGQQSRFPASDVPRVLHWSNYSAKAVALIQARAGE
jgi:DNA polymerase I